MKRIAMVFTVVALLAIIGWQQYQIHQMKLEIAKLDRTAADTVQLLNMQNTLNKLFGILLPGGVDPINKLMSDRLNKFDYYPRREEREKSEAR